MRENEGAPLINLGTNLYSLGVTGIIVLNDKVGIVNGMIATIAGLGFVGGGVTLRDGG